MNNLSLIRLGLIFLLLISLPWAQANTDSASVPPKLTVTTESFTSDIQANHYYPLQIKLHIPEGWILKWRSPIFASQQNQLIYPQEIKFTNQALYFDAPYWPLKQYFHSSSIPVKTLLGYTGQVTLFTEFSSKTPLDLAHPSNVTVTVPWEMCAQANLASCIQGETEHQIQLPQSQRSTEHQAQPKPFQLPQSTRWPAHYEFQDEQLILLIDSEEAVELLNSGHWSAFIDAPNPDHSAQVQIQQLDKQVILQQSNPLATDQIKALIEHGVPLKVELIQTDASSKQTASQAYELIAKPVTTPNHLDEPNPPYSFSLVLGFAFLGGLILNLMPCVFPVLSLKALSFNASDSRENKKQVLWYTVGVVASFLAVASVLLILRATGEALGWGFQLQSPWLIALLTFLFFAIGLNLSGLFEVATQLMGAGSQLLNPQSKPKSQSLDSFLTGVLAVVVASPCTAPFMGVALGFAITQPPYIALSVFAVLALGMAAPFILIGFLPSHWIRLPKPGAWMNTFKQWMAFPMYLTAVWLCWVFARQAGVNSLAMLLLGLVILAAALWQLGVLQQKQKKVWLTRLLLLGLFVLALASYALALSFTQAQNNTEPLDNVWSQTRLDQIKTQQPVFVNMTADWCITCLANEKIALNVSSTQALFKQYDIQVLTGDWTLQDPKITEYLATFGRNGVPLYVLYWPGQTPYVLPQILTPEIIKKTVEVHAQSSHVLSSNLIMENL